MTREHGRSRTLIIAGVFAAALCALIVTFAFFERPRYALEMLYERHRIERALDAYFAAEMRGDLGAVYRSLAPSSDYRRTHTYDCLLYTSDAADDLLCVDFGGRRLLKKKNKKKTQHTSC